MLNHFSFTPVNYSHTIKTNKMKKKLAIIQLLILIGLSSFSQEVSKDEVSKKFVIALTAGPSFPVGQYGLMNLNHQESGFAKFGFNLNLNFAYQLEKHFGLASSVIYAQHVLNIDELKKLPDFTNAKADHYQYWGVLLGPMATVNLSKKVLLDFKFLAGVASANAPVIKSDSGVISNEKWSDAFVYQYGTDIRYNFNPTVCFFSNIYYNHTKPVWKLVNGSVEKNMGVFDFNLGFGYNF